MTVYVRWYGKVLEGELLDGESMGMKQVRIPLDGHHPVALFTPGHVYDTVEKMQEVAKEVYSYPKEFPKLGDIIHPDLPMPYPADDYLKLEMFKRDNWDHEHNHLRTDKLDEFYSLWRMVMTPFGYAEAPDTTQRSFIAEAVPQNRTPVGKPQPHIPARQKPSRKMLRSAGQQEFKDSTQLSLFEL